MSSSSENRRSVPAWLRKIYLYNAQIHYPRRKEGGRMGIRLSDLVEAVPGERVNFRDAEIRGVTCDSRQVQSGALFVAVPGHKADGASFVDDAIRRGASAVSLSVKSRPSRSGTCIASKYPGVTLIM